MQLNKYGVQWEVIAKPVKDDVEITITNGGLSFIGNLEIDICLGFYIWVGRIDKEHITSEPMLFYAEELEQFCDLTNETAEQKKWYHKLRDGYKFHKSPPLYSMKYEDDEETDFIPLLVDEYKEISGLLTTIPKAIYVYPWKRELLTVRKDIYEQLPDPWTVQDLYAPIQKQIEYMYNIFEQPWREIAERRAAEKPIKIIVRQPTDAHNELYTYYEKQTPYNIRVHKILHHNTVYFDKEHER